jgi:hypothetical protein
MYDADMAEYLRGNQRAEAVETLRNNIELMKRWDQERK